MTCLPRRLAVSVPLVLALSCGSSKPSDRPPTAQPGAQASVPAPLTPVAAPADVFVVARVLAPSRLIDTGTRWAGFPLDWRTLLSREAPGAEQALMLDLPLDLAVMLDPTASMEPKVLLAFSVGLRSVDSALAFFRERGELTRSGQNRVELGGNFSCVVARALGPAPARLVCSGDEESVDALLPYMTRGLPTETVGKGDIVARLEMGPLRRRYGAQLTLLKTAGVPFVMKELAVDDPAFDRPLREALYGTADELIDVVNELGRISIGVDVNAEQERIEVETQALFTGQKSRVSQFFASAASQEATAPEAFFKLPGDATSASFSNLSDSAVVEKPVTVLTALLGGWLEYVGLPEAKRKPLIDSLRGALLHSAQSVYAELPVSPAVKKNDTDEAREALKLALGQHILEVGQEDGKYREFLAALAAALGDRTFRAKLEEKKLVAPGALPSMRQKAPKGGKGLPKDATLFEIEIPRLAFVPGAFGPSAVPPAGAPGAKPKAPPGESLRAYVLLVKEGSQTKVLFGAEEAALYDRFASARAAAASETVGAREGLGMLRERKAFSGGFTTVRGLMDSLRSPAEDPSAVGRLTNAMPYQGTVPMPYSASVAPSGPELTVRFTVPKAVIQDAAAGIAGGLANDLKLPGSSP